MGYQREPLSEEESQIVINKDQNLLSTSRVEGNTVIVLASW